MSEELDERTGALDTRVSEELDERTGDFEFRPSQVKTDHMKSAYVRLILSSWCGDRYSLSRLK